MLSGTWTPVAILYVSLSWFYTFCLQRQLDSESSKVSSKKAMEKIEMLQNRRQEVNNNIIMVLSLLFHCTVFVTVKVSVGVRNINPEPEIIFFSFFI